MSTLAVVVLAICRYWGGILDPGRNFIPTL